ncbi:MAG: Aspartyl-tRNA synthetase [Parcubacteria group bacterium GW2011_GWA2_51_10]|nr:MAG: Aspartyl-tRNA synthetase [Parcubacteria group bacterium GW2011_GWA2_51_10]
MERTINRELPAQIGKTVTIAGWVDVRRDHGKLIFLDVRDRSGIVQCVVTPRASEAMEIAKELRPQFTVAIVGELKERPENMRGAGPFGGIELSVQSVVILSRAQELPFDMSAELNLDTHLDYLPLTLRTARSRDIFTMQETILEGFRSSMRKQDFTEFTAPAIVGEDAEGGAAAFRVSYHHDTSAFLATSPQFYKQIMVGPFERAFTVAKIFRAEKHSTTRHLSEATSLDFEMGFIESHREPMAVLSRCVSDIVSLATERHPDMFERFDLPPPVIGDEIPTLTLREAQKILGVTEAPDLDPAGERSICEWAKKERASDFVFITAFPTKARAFYTYEDPHEAPYSRGFDLLFRGLEINSGSQRMHDYDALIGRMHERGLDPQKFSFYLQAFKYGLPPHGGSATGLERMTARMLGIANVKEATAFPRDLNRIDIRLSE